jgi:hypothetical protein
VSSLEGSSSSDSSSILSIAGAEKEIGSNTGAEGGFFFEEDSPRGSKEFWLGKRGMLEGLGVDLF